MKLGEMGNQQTTLSSLCPMAIFSASVDLELSAVISRRGTYVPSILSLEVLCIRFQWVPSSDHKRLCSSLHIPPFLAQR